MFAKLFGGFNRSDEGSRIGIADRVAVLIPGGLREHASHLGLARVSGLSFGLACPSYSFLFHYGQARSVHLYIQNGNRFTDDHG